ncbi:MAG: 2-amino-4-hydroxy-6-hydroxymethyldihydropteridine diphosphokinase [Bacteroidales bacterium]|jgi:2-amino-4-hydroxy-6-hydroxymethyldihydropteridine diphosphokinase|nr:2-amino-4-hydroxy-6-hydroxymethyldihydropteridine diphosphokinase [Bacteroidales bacterium]
MNMKEVVLGLGTNVGRREDNLARAIDAIRSRVGNILRVSSVYETEPWGFETDSSFLNMALVAETALGAGTLISNVLGIESSMGRQRSGSAYESRVIDIDILFFGDEVIGRKGLDVPHPRLHLRKFVLVPLNEIMPGFMHPVLGKTIHGLLEECDDRSLVALYRPGP